MKKNGKRSWQFALCLENSGYPASLEVGKLYRVIADRTAKAHGYVRIVDESGDDYAFAASRFHLVRLPSNVGEALVGAK
jgi:hypothetical protein